MATEIYIPIACSVYDVLEASAVKNASIRLDIKHENETVHRDAKILDLFSKDKTEFLKAKDINTNEEFTLRLDAINLITDLATKKKYSPRACSMDFTYS
jgi:transcriptional antiterminator Rof (Rho-off)